MKLVWSLILLMLSVAGYSQQPPAATMIGRKCLPRSDWCGLGCWLGFSSCRIMAPPGSN
jgi:hypothetical protein